MSSFEHLSPKLQLLDLFIVLAFKVILSCWKEVSKLSALTWWNLIYDEHRIHTVSLLTVHQKIKSDLYWLPFNTFFSLHSSLS